MYLAIDIGGTKTLLTVFGDDGTKIEDKKFMTNKDYAVFISDIKTNITEMSTKSFTACAVAAPGRLDRSSGVAISLGNLDWKNVPIRDDISQALGGVKTVIENDAKAAGLAEASALAGQYNKVVYITVSTGIGVAFIEDSKIPKDLRDAEIGKVPLQYEGKTMAWESFASGKAISKKYNKMASEIDDDLTWHEIGLNIAYGTAICCGVFQPEAIVFGGGAGKYAERFTKTIADYLTENLHPNISQPKALLAATYPDDSVTRGCYILLQNNEA